MPPASAAMNGIDRTSCSPFQPDPDHQNSTSNSGDNDIHIDPALHAIPVDPTLLTEGGRASVEVCTLVAMADAVVHERVASRSCGRSRWKPRSF